MTRIILGVNFHPWAKFRGFNIITRLIFYIKPIFHSFFFAHNLFIQKMEIGLQPTKNGKLRPQKIHWPSANFDLDILRHHKSLCIFPFNGFTHSFPKIVVDINSFAPDFQKCQSIGAISPLISRNGSRLGLFLPHSFMETGATVAFAPILWYKLVFQLHSPL